MKSPNKPDAPNPAIAPRFQVGPHWRGVGDPGRWAELLRGRSRAGGWNGSLVSQVRPVRLCSGGRCPTFRAADRGGSGPVDDVGGPGG